MFDLEYYYKLKKYIDIIDNYLLTKCHIDFVEDKKRHNYHIMNVDVIKDYYDENEELFSYIYENYYEKKMNNIIEDIKKYR